MKSLLILLVCVIPSFTTYVITTTEPTTWSIYELELTEREQVTLLRSMVEEYPTKISINGDINEDEIVFVLMKGTKQPTVLPEEKPTRRIPSKYKENIFGVFGGDVSAEPSAE